MSLQVSKTCALCGNDRRTEIKHTVLRDRDIITLCQDATACDVRVRVSAIKINVRSTWIF